MNKKKPNISLMKGTCIPSVLDFGAWSLDRDSFRAEDGPLKSADFKGNVRDLTIFYTQRT